MRSIHLIDLCSMEYSIRHAIVHMQYWRENSNWVIPEGGRSNTAVMAVLGVEAAYVDIETREVLAQVAPGDLAVIPQGYRYEFVVRRVDKRGRSVADMPNGSYFWDGIKSDSQEHGRVANVIFLGFELFDENGEPITIGSRIHVLRAPATEQLFWRSEHLAKLSGSAVAPQPALVIADMYHLLTQLSSTVISKKVRSSSYYRIEPALRYLEQQPLGAVTVEQLSNVCALSPSAFRRIFRQEMGVSPIDYLHDRTMNRAMELLSSGELTVQEVALECGYDDSFYFSRFFRKQIGLPPSKWKQQNGSKDSR